MRGEGEGYTNEWLCPEDEEMGRVVDLEEKEDKEEMGKEEDTLNEKDEEEV